MSGVIKNGIISVPWKLHTTWKYKYINENVINKKNNKAWKEVKELPVLLPANGILIIPTSKSCCDKLELNESYKVLIRKLESQGVL